MAEQPHWYAGKPDKRTLGWRWHPDTEAYARHVGKARELTKAGGGLRDQGGQQGKRGPLADE